VTLDDIERLVAYVIEQNYKFPLEVVATLTGLERADIVGDLTRHLSSYPEQDCRQKYIHFLICERAFRWHSEGEDRNRCYFWSSTPFYGLEFFAAAMGCPDERKAHYALYREFLLQLSPAAAAIEHAGMGVSITSEQLRTSSRAAAFLRERPDVRRLLEGRSGGTRGYAADSTVVRSLRQQLASCDALRECLSVPEVAHTVELSVGHTREQLDLLFTITAIVEDLTTGKSVLEHV
jgi:asparagine synthase (glutamine-hydrolysing)